MNRWMPWGQGAATVSGRNPAANWWDLFGSEPLNATMQRALAGNRNLAAAQATLAQAREAVNASAGALYPQLSLDAGAGRQKYGAQFASAQQFPPFSLGRPQRQLSV